jgi:hypothetical protein
MMVAPFGGAVTWCVAKSGRTAGVFQGPWFERPWTIKVVLARTWVMSADSNDLLSEAWKETHVNDKDLLRFGFGYCHSLVHVPCLVWKFRITSTDESLFSNGVSSAQSKGCLAEGWRKGCFVMLSDISHEITVKGSLVLSYYSEL